MTGDTYTANGIAYQSCPDCPASTSSSSTTVYSCTTRKCKITSCPSTQKLNSAGTACINKDDTCPTNYYKSCETGTQGEPKYTEAGTACYQCKPNIKISDCAALKQAIEKATSNETVTMDADVTCTDTSVTLKDYVTLDGAGHTLAFNLTQIAPKPGLILGRYSNVSNLTLNMTTKYRGEKTSYVIGVVKDTGALKIPKEGGYNTIENFNLYLKADTEPRSESGYYPMVAIEASPITFKGTNNFIDKGSVCSQDVNNLTYPVNAKTAALYATDDTFLLNLGTNAVLNIKTNGCWSTGINYASINMTDNAKINIETYGSSSNGFSDTSGSDDGVISMSGNTEFNVLAKGDKSSGIFADSIRMTDNTVLNAYAKNSYAVYYTAMSGNTGLEMKKNSRLNAKTAGTATYTLAAVEGRAALYDNAKVNAYNIAGGKAISIYHQYLTLNNYAEFNSEATSSSSSCLSANVDFTLKSPNAKLRIKCGGTFSPEDSIFSTEIENAVVGATIETPYAKYTCNTAVSKTVRIPKGNAVDIPNFSKNTGSRLTTMPSDFKSIFTQGIFVK